MGSVLPKPLTFKNVDTLVMPHFDCAAVEMNGWRSSMEDAHSLFTINVTAQTMLVGIFDGHNGPEASVFAARNLEKILATEPLPITEKRLTEIVVQVDRAFMDSGAPDGSTGVFALITAVDGAPGQYDLLVANIGDSRCMVGDGATKSCVSLTEDHKPTNPSESQRITSAGAMVSNGRVNGDLAVSRAFGDAPYKTPGLPPAAQAVSVVPDYTTHRIKAGDFVVLACDGVFESNFTNEQVVAYVGKELASHGDVALATARVIDEALRRGSKDNISCIIVWRKDVAGVTAPVTNHYSIPGEVQFTSGPYRHAFVRMCQRGDTTPELMALLRYDMLRAAITDSGANPDWPSVWTTIKETGSLEDGKAELERFGAVPDGDPAARLEHCANLLKL
eukprot:PhM_4_TR11312/c1_g1_i1/m.99429